MWTIIILVIADVISNAPGVRVAGSILVAAVVGLAAGLIDVPYTIGQARSCVGGPSPATMREGG